MGLVMRSVEEDLMMGLEKQCAKWCCLTGGKKVTHLLYRLVWTEHESTKFAAVMGGIFHFNEFGLKTEGHLR